MLQHAPETIHRVNGKVAVSAIYPFDVLILPNVQFVVLSNLAVVLQSFVAVGLLVRAGEGHVANLKQLWRREKNHVRGVVEQRVAQAPFVHQKGREPGPLSLDRASQPRRTRTDYK